MAKKKTSAKTQTPYPKGPMLALPDGDSEEITPQSLLLDPQNLRLFEKADVALQKTSASLIGQPSIQAKIYSTMLEDDRFEIPSLATSVMYNGFLKHERLIVARYDSRSYLVL